MASNLLIAIVDDDESAREAVAGLVRSLGFMAAEFGSGVEFLQSGRLAHTACLIADMRMSGMTGLELHCQLVQSGTPMPTILMTAHADDAARSRALEAGIDCYLPKPMEPEGLLECIRSALADRA